MKVCPDCGSSLTEIIYYGDLKRRYRCRKCGIEFDDNAIMADFSQDAKADEGKPKLTLVPTQIIYDIAAVREYGNQKYGDPDNWKTVDIKRYRDAMFRHFLAYLKDPHGRDAESGLPHWWHVCCNAAFISEMEEYDED